MRDANDTRESKMTDRTKNHEAGDQVTIELTGKILEADMRGNILVQFSNGPVKFDDPIWLTTSEVAKGVTR